MAHTGSDWCRPLRPFLQFVFSCLRRKVLFQICTALCGRDGDGEDSGLEVTLVWDRLRSHSDKGPWVDTCLSKRVVLHLPT